jgi:hypothetical protein
MPGKKPRAPNLERLVTRDCMLHTSLYHFRGRLHGRSRLFGIPILGLTAPRSRKVRELPRKLYQLGLKARQTKGIPFLEELSR